MSIKDQINAIKTDLPRRLKEKIADLLCEANNMKRGFDMSGPIDRGVMAYSRKGTVSDKVGDFKDSALEGKTLHMYTVEELTMGGQIIDPVTFMPTGEHREPQKVLIMRFGVSN